MMKDFFDKKLSIKVHLMVSKVENLKKNNFFNGARFTPKISRNTQISLFFEIFHSFSFVKI